MVSEVNVTFPRVFVEYLVKTKLPQSEFPRLMLVIELGTLEQCGFDDFNTRPSLNE